MCPVLLLKSIAELFPGTMNLATTNLTIITIAQKTNLKSLRWHTDVETEKLAKNVSYMITQNLSKALDSLLWNSWLVTLETRDTY